MDRTCATKYPIMLIHGIGYSDTGAKNYWGRIPELLKSHGAEIFFGDQDAFGSIESNAAQLKQTAEKALKGTGAKKLNLIAHSKGGLEARYMISGLDMADQIASLSTVATPHRGILSMDEIKSKAGWVYKTLLRLFNMMLLFDGGERNWSLELYEQLTTDYMRVFNELVLDADAVYYQSYAFDMKNRKSDPAMGLFYSFVRKIEGPNDGLVSVESAKWGDFKGVYSGPGQRGISHPRAVHSKGQPITGVKTGGGLLDITDLYWDIACGLKAMGY